MQPTEPVVVVPARGLVLLVGAAGAGKSTFAARHFRSTEVLSSDAFRALVSDDEGDQSATAPAFDVLARVLAHRLRRGRLSVIDATNVAAADRGGWLRLAAQARRATVAIVFDLPESLCMERNAQRIGRVLDAAVIRRQWAGVRRSLADPARFLAEGYAAVHILEDPAVVDLVRVVRADDLPRPAMPDSGVRSRPRGADAGPDGARRRVSQRPNERPDRTA